jgi:hypothetical protein
MYRYAQVTNWTRHGDRICVLVTNFLHLEINGEADAFVLISVNQSID